MKRTPKLVSDAKKLRKRGLSFSEIGRRLGVGVNTICRWVDESLREKCNAESKEWRANNKLRTWANNSLGQARTRARRKKLPFDLDVEFIRRLLYETNGVCPVLGIPLVFGVKVLGMRSPTLDRLVPENGYVKSNVKVISHRANSIKSNATAPEIQAVATWLQSQTT